MEFFKRNVRNVMKRVFAGIVGSDENGLIQATSSTGGTDCSSPGRLARRQRVETDTSSQCPLIDGTTGSMIMMPAENPHGLDTSLDSSAAETVEEDDDAWGYVVARPLDLRIERADSASSESLVYPGPRPSSAYERFPCTSELLMLPIQLRNSFEGSVIISEGEQQSLGRFTKSYMGSSTPGSSLNMLARPSSVQLQPRSIMPLKNLQSRSTGALRTAVEAGMGLHLKQSASSSFFSTELDTSLVRSFAKTEENQVRASLGDQPILNHGPLCGTEAVREYDYEKAVSEYDDRKHSRTTTQSSLLPMGSPHLRCSKAVFGRVTEQVGPQGNGNHVTVTPEQGRRSTVLEVKLFPHRFLQSNIIGRGVLQQLLKTLQQAVKILVTGS